MNYFAGLFFVAAVTASPQIFSDIYTSCEFEYVEKKIVFPDKLWTISNTDFTLHFSFCKSVQSSCHKLTPSCLIQKSNNQSIDLGSEFTLDADSEDFNLKSTSQTKCPQNPSKNYTLSIILLCSDSIKPQPRLMTADDEDDCTFEVTMMKPDCRPKCTEIIDNSYLLDIRSFKKSIQVESDSKKFSLSLCGSNRDCSGGTSACEIINNDKIPLASLESQYLNYDVGKNELTARGRYKQQRVVRDVQILIKCNWATDVANLKYKKPLTQGKHYKFELESSFGCIKLPHKCTLSSIDNLHYNLTELYKIGGWQVAGAPQGEIFVNICGPLDQKDLCQDQQSQVCHIDNNNYVNRGSILSFLKAGGDIITAKFVSGSTCQENPQFLYSTQIDFICDRNEKGPVFKEFKGCVMLLLWETPRACPVDFYRGQNCYMNDRVSNRNLQKLYTKTDNVYFITPNKTKLIYNICGAIHETCNGYSNVSFCLKTEQKETVIGWDQRELLSDNGLLRLELQGSTCPNRRSIGEIAVHFVCDYHNPSPATQIAVIEDSCKFNVTIFTPSACASPDTFDSCVYSTANLTYDLTPLVQKSKNYVIEDQNVDYVFNLCGPLVTGPGALCGSHTMFCQNNRTEMNVKNKYMSLGGVGRPRLLNNSLVVEAKMGSFCQGLGYYMSVIYFECSEQKYPPMLLSKDKCVYKFKWRTPEACPKEEKCIVASAKGDARLDLTPLQIKAIKLNVDNKTNQYEFHLCLDTYKQSDDLSTNTYSLKREFLPYEQNSYLVLDLEKKCENSTISKVFFEFSCSQTLDDYFEQTAFEKCILNVTIYTRRVCPNPKENFAYSVIEPEGVDKTSRNKSVAENLTRIERNCTLKNAYTGHEFNLRKIEAEEMLLNNDSFILNLSGNSTKCSGIFCKNSVKMVANVCPRPSYNYTHQSVILHFTGEYNCHSNDLYELEVVLKCNQTKSSGKFLKNEKCKFILLYNLPEACSLLKQEIISAGYSSVVAGSVIGTVAILSIIVGIFIYVKRRQCRYIQYILFRRDKADVSIYSRDSRI